MKKNLNIPYPLIPGKHILFKMLGIFAVKGGADGINC